MGNSQKKQKERQIACGAELLIHADDPYCFAQFYCELPKGHPGSHASHFEKAATERNVSNFAVEARGTVRWQDERYL
jgi:hypothetical protein